MGHAQMRTSNMGLVLRHLHDHGGRSRASLAAEVGLSKASISSIVAELAERGLVCESRGESQGRVGRPGIEVTIDGRHVCGVGVEINVDYLMACVVDLTGVIRFEHTEPMPPQREPDAVIDALVRIIGGLLKKVADQGLWTAGILIAPPGVIDDATGALIFAPNLGWRNVPLRARLEELLGPSAPPIGLESDAKLSAVAAYAESGHTGDVQDLVFLTGDVGVGAGIIAGGRLVRGWSGFSGEVGHMRVHDAGIVCTCGRRGCWERYVGLPVLLDATPSGSAARDLHLPMSERLEAVRAHMVAGERGVVTAFEEIRAELTLGVAVLVDVLNPQVLVLGGYFSVFADEFAEPLQRALDERSLDAGGRVRVRTTAHGLEAAAVGGALVALERVLDDPSQVPRQPAR